MARQELVDFLLTVDKQHIIDLVDIITNFGKGRSTLNSTVKDVLILAKESNRNFTKDEINLLLIEFQKYGGDTFANAIRSKDNLITYHEILNDVFKLLIGDKNQLNNEKKEQKIIQTLFSTKWESIPFEDGYKKSIDMGKIISKNITDGIKNKSLIDYTSNILTRGNPLGIIGSFALGLSSPALRITIPFVVQISWLKMMKQNYWDKQEIESVKILSNQDLLITDAADKDVILSLTEYTEPPKIKNEFNESNISSFNQLFSNIPSLATKFETVKNQIVSINIDPRKLTLAKDGNGLRGMVHGVNKDGKFGVTENVRIFESNTLKQVINSGVIFNLASTVVAQKHLADINEKLKEIQKGINEIRHFQEDERRSKIDTTIKLLKLVSEHMTGYGQETPIFNENKGRLQKGLDDNLAIKSHLEKDLHRVFEQICNIKFDSFMGMNNSGDVKSMIKRMKEWDKYYESYQLCCNVVMMTYAILYMGNANKINKEFYSNELKTFVSDTDKFISSRVTKIQEHFRQANKNAQGITNFESSTLAYEVLFDRCNEDFKLYQQELIQQLTRIATSATTPMPFKATLLIENGKIQGGQFLLDQTKE
ncbi:hypothetical protein [Neisseria subflava]|uniref:hypothetical protein n=3 Tax=Neisseria TaxID=482 RepID=UPI00202AB2B6|nr:hypothetical protein [Neisseria subflava]MCL9764903.1 hypothetical protein [Neisseria subflava]